MSPCCEGKTDEILDRLILSLWIPIWSNSQLILILSCLFFYFRTLAPTLGGSIYAWSIVHGVKIGFPFDMNLVFILFSFTYLISNIMCARLPESLNRQSVKEQVCLQDDEVPEPRKEPLEEPQRESHSELQLEPQREPHPGPQRELHPEPQREPHSETQDTQ